LKTGYNVIVVDSYAWIEYFAGTEKGLEVKQILEAAEEAYTPSIVLAEISSKYAREGADTETIRRRLETITEITPVVPISPAIALKIPEARRDLLENTRKQGIKKKPGLADAIVLATTRHLKGKVVTADQHFKQMKETIWIG